MPRAMPSIGIVLAASPARTAPKTMLTPARGSIRRLSSAGTSTTTRPSACTRSAVRWGRAVCPPRPVSRTSTMSVGRGERAGAHRDQADRQLREAVQREDRLDVLQAALRDHLGRAGRELLLARLEDQPYPAGQLAAGVELGQRQPGAEQDRGVHVVAARVADVVDRRPVGHVLGVRQRQRVEVGPQRDRPGRPRRCRRSRRCPWAAGAA